MKTRRAIHSGDGFPVFPVEPGWWFRPMLEEDTEAPVLPAWEHLADSGALGTWERFEAGEETLREAVYVGRARVSLPRQRDARREDALGTEARLGTLQADEAAT